MEKKLPFHTDNEFDKLIDLLDQSEQLKERIRYLKKYGNQLTDEVDGFITFYEANDGDVDKIKNKLVEFKKGFYSKKNKFKIYVRWAATITILIGTSIFFYLNKISQTRINNTNSTYEDIGIPIYMKEKQNSSIDWEEIMYNYKTNQYQKILQIQNTKSNDTLYYYQGIAAFKQKNFTKSIRILNNVNHNSIYFNKANYFKAIDYLHLKERDLYNKAILNIHLEKNDPYFNLYIKKLKKI